MIDVILNVYNRPYTLKKQIDAVLTQSVSILPKNIHIWFNNLPLSQDSLNTIVQNYNTYICNWNTKFWGRFTIPLLLDSPYILLLDDDIIPL